MAAVTVAVLVALVACIAVLVMRAMKDPSTPVIPSPPSLPIVGHLMWFFNVDVDNVFQIMRRLLADLPVCKMSLLNTTIVFVSDPTCIGELVRRKDLNDKSVLGYSLLHVLAKRGLIQLGGTEWKEHRTWLAPGFKKSVLDTFVADFNGVAKDFVKTVHADVAMELDAAVTKPMTSAFMITSLGGDWDKEGEVVSVTNFISEFFATVMRRIFNPLLWPDRVYMLTPSGQKLQRKKVEIDLFTKKFIIQKREALKNKMHDEPETTRKTLMDIMIATPENKEPMSEEAIQDEVKTSFAASVETSATAMCWALKILTLEPEVQARLHAELDEVFGDSDREVGVEDISKLKYMERFFKEVLRMYPPVPFIARQCYQKTELWGYPIPGNTTVAINVFGAHRDVRYWPEPGRFDPDRFLPEVAKERHPYAYIPFSAGARNCIGGTYAMQLLTTFLATTLRAYTVHPVDDGLANVVSLTDNMTYKVTSGLRGGFRIKFRSRGAGHRPRTRPTASG